jgi:hypothetical protein
VVLSIFKLYHKMFRVMVLCWGFFKKGSCKYFLYVTKSLNVNILTQNQKLNICNSRDPNDKNLNIELIQIIFQYL